MAGVREAKTKVGDRCQGTRRCDANIAFVLGPAHVTTQSKNNAQSRVRGHTWILSLGNMKSDDQTPFYLFHDSDHIIVPLAV